MNKIKKSNSLRKRPKPKLLMIKEKKFKNQKKLLDLLEILIQKNSQQKSVIDSSKKEWTELCSSSNKQEMSV